ncbi:MAG: multicopper oxidase domain-containing protein, partial [Thermodesulfobacteriota bacterium]
MTITDFFGTGTGATATATVAGGVITGITVTNAGTGYIYPVISISDPTGGGAAATAAVGPKPDGSYDGGIRKFVDGLPGLGAAGANNLDQYIPVATPDIVTYPGSDYYEIELRQYSERMHSDLGPTTQRGYIQVNKGTDTSNCNGQNQPACTAANNTVNPDPVVHHLGPLIVAQKDRPVRVKFINKLPTGNGGDLFIPVDESIMGAGPFSIDYDPVTKEPIPLTNGTFAQNRATLHLHGGITPWISDGTPHQWITPANDPKAPLYKKGVSSKNVPDMPDPGPGAATFYWTNQQSARLMFYHDHAWGITRLNVYVGEAAGYLIRDEMEQTLIAGGIIPADEIPLIIEDKTFVDPATIKLTDPTWRWGSQPWAGGNNPMTPVLGDLWWPHVYMSAENPFDITGIAPMGRWAYGPYFWPPTTGIPYPPVPNPYYDPNCDPNGDPALVAGLKDGFCQPPEIPGTPNPSWGAEAFLDTPTVNGTAYPVLNVDPKAYRFRILNAAHDRFYNLQLYEADAATPAGCPTCAANSEVRMVPAMDYTAMAANDPRWPSTGNNPQPATWAMDARPGGAPDWNTVGPDWIQIGTEAGFLAKPAVMANNPVIWNNDVTTFNAGNVDSGTMILAPAERADVIIDFSQYAGKTLILYNDAPAPFPALDPHYDYFTEGAEDMVAAGGLMASKVGFGPNTRTIMKIVVAPHADPQNPTPAFNLAALEDAFATGNGTGVAKSIFEQSQHPIIVGQSDYNGIYSTNPTFPATWPNWGLSRIIDNQISYEDIYGATHTSYLEPKAIQDEMGETFDDYGRLSAKLGLEMAFTTAGIQTFIVQNYVDPPTEILDDGVSQVWKITHNGVDTHPLHFHLYDVQVINRVGWDGFIRKPFPNEYGWKDTVRISPLEDTIVALRPAAPKLPFGVPESIRPHNPMEPLGSTIGFTNLDPLTGQPNNPPTVNEMVNLDWEYVIHCHILSHEESDMMRTVKFNYVEELPQAPTNLAASALQYNKVDLTWTDRTPANAQNTPGNPANEIGFKIERSTDGVNFTEIGTAIANSTSYADTTGASGVTYVYRIRAYNAAGVSPYSNTANGVAVLFATLSASPSSPRVAGTTVTLTGLVPGGTGNYEYRFWTQGPGTNNVLTELQAYSTNSSINWNTSQADIGNTTFWVWVRSVGSNAQFDAQATLKNYRINPAPATGVTLSPNPASPQLAGTTVTLAAQGSGGTGNYEYRFWTQGPGTNNVLTELQAYSTNSSINWNTSQADI